MRKYITFNLGDNDFSSSMRSAFEYMKNEYPQELKEAPLEQIKLMVIHLMIGYQMAQQHYWGGEYSTKDPMVEMQHYFKYFQPIRICDTKEETLADHNYAACSINLNDGPNFGYVWTH